MVIKDGLGRVFFHFKAPPASKRATSSSTKASTTDRKGALPPTLRHRLAKADYVRAVHSLPASALLTKSSPSQLDETDGSEGDSRPPSPEPKAKKLSVESTRKRSPFLPKALAALGTFIASGLFHEYVPFPPSSLSSSTAPEQIHEPPRFRRRERSNRRLLHRPRPRYDHLLVRTEAFRTAARLVPALAWSRRGERFCIWEYAAVYGTVCARRVL